MVCDKVNCLSDLEGGGEDNSDNTHTQASIYGGRVSERQSVNSTRMGKYAADKQQQKNTEREGEGERRNSVVSNPC